MLNNVRYAIRALFKTPGFTAVSILTLALCIGANVVIFAVIDAILVRPLPFTEPERLMVVFNRYPGAGVERSGASIANYYERRGAIKGFRSIALYQPTRSIVGEAGSPNVVDNDRVTPDFFATLGVPLAKGRTFNDNEMLPAGSRVAILTDAFWRKNFNADPEVLGRTFQVDSQSVTVIGVLPPDFRYLSSAAQFFTPAASEPQQREAGARHNNSYQLIARLAPGSTVAIAQSQIDAFNVQQLDNDPAGSIIKNAGFETKVYPLHADYVSGIRPTLLILQGGVLFLLLIGGANLVNLLLIRASGRSKEIAIRQALGAQRLHIASEVTLETTLLAMSGGLVGLAFGAIGIRLLSAAGTNQLPLGSTIALDGRVATITLAASFVVGVALASPVLWYTLRTWLAPALQSDTRGGTVSRAAQRMRHGFIVAQVALAFVLLSGAGLLALSLQRVLDTAPGFQPDRVLTGQLSLPDKKYPDIETRLAFIERLLSELRTQPGVTNVGITSNLPMTGRANNMAIAIEGIEPKSGESMRAHYVSAASADYFRALGVPLLQGRLLDDADNYREQKVCVVDEEFARRYWPGQSALGHRLSNGVLNEENAHTIVGVVGNIKQNDLSERSALGALYFPYKSFPTNQLYVALRTSLTPEVLGPTLTQTVLRLDPELPVDQLKSMQTWIDDSLVSRRSPAVLASIFGGVALLLAAIGTYGVLAYTVGQRTREIGVRMALGALPRQILTQFLGLSAKLLIAGLSIGVVGAWFTGRAMQSELFGVSAFQAGILLATAAIMIFVVMLATFLPSRSASRVDPLVALRAE